MEKAPFIGELDPRDKPLFAATAEDSGRAISVVTKMQAIEYDPAKRGLTLDHRGLDMARAAEVFEGSSFTISDSRRDYGEQRFITAGFLDGRMIVVVWTPRGAARRVISMRRANVREIAKYKVKLDRP